MDITTNIQIILKVCYPQEAPTDFAEIYHWYSDKIFENKQQFRWKYF